MSHRQITAMIVLSVFAFGAWAQSPAQTQSQDKDLGQRKPSRHSGLPVVGEFQRQPESEADEKLRKIREDQYENDPSRAHAPISDPGLANGTESTSSTIIDYITVTIPGAHQNAPGIPVVIGTVLTGKSFISKNHTAVYSDYQLRIEEILKQGAATTLAVGDQVVASRRGGAIQFPSGHRRNFLILGEGLPEIRSKCVLFLWKLVPNQPVWEIASGYQLKDGRVYPLDDINTPLYDGMSESVFLDLIKKRARQ